MRQKAGPYQGAKGCMGELQLNWKKKKKRIALLSCCLVLLAAGCKREEAIITDDGKDITQAEKEYETLSQSSAAKFSYDDLRIDNLRCFVGEDEVKLHFGEPDRIVNMEAGGIDETHTGAKEKQDKVYVYGDRTLTFSYLNGSYQLTAVESSHPTDMFAREIAVGKSVEDILKVYYRDAEFMNHSYYAEDKTTVIGKYLYGAYTIDSLETVKPSGKVEYGVVHFNGYASMEEAEKYIIEMTYFEPPYKSGTADFSDDFAQIAFDIDKGGKISSVRWYYYPEEASIIP